LLLQLRVKTHLCFNDIISFAIAEFIYYRIDEYQIRWFLANHPLKKLESKVVINLKPKVYKKLKKLKNKYKISLFLYQILW